MGNKPPAPDARLQETIELFGLEEKDIGKLWKIFRRYDKDKSGTVDTREFYMLVHEKPSVFADSIFELIDVENEGQLDFSEFVKAIATYCMFGKDDILKFCFYIFDKDKNGYIEEDELHALVQMLHHNAMNSNLKMSLEKLDKNKDGRIDFKEFQAMNSMYPQVIFPAFRMQSNMMMYTLGTKFWLGRRNNLEKKRIKVIKKSQKIKAMEEKRLKAIQNREIKRRMGAFKYYAMPWERAKFAAAVDSGKKKKKKKKNRGKADKSTLRKQKKTDKQDFGPDGAIPGADRDEEKRERRKKKRDAKTGEVSDAAERKARRKERRKRDKNRS